MSQSCIRFDVTLNANLKEQSKVRTKYIAKALIILIWASFMLLLGYQPAEFSPVLFDHSGQVQKHQTEQYRLNRLIQADTLNPLSGQLDHPTHLPEVLDRT